MTTDLETLARRAVACKHWKWMPGMRVMVPPKHDGSTGFSIRLGEYGYVPAPHEYPDLSDPATLGCLLALVRERFPNATTNWGMVNRERRWAAHHVRAGAYFYSTEAEALVAALEAAP